MGLTSLKLGSLIELSGEKNQDGIYGINDVRGINNLKEMMESKADLNGRDLTKFQIVKPGEFVFNHRTSRNGGKFSITYNYDAVPHIFTEDYVVFHIKDECTETVLKEWLYLYFCRSEFDRFVITNSWGSSTEFFNWSDLCDIDITLPDIETQRKFVNVFLSLRENLAVYQSKAEEIKIVCDGYIEDLKRKYPLKRIGDYIEENDDRNWDLKLGIDDVVGVSNQKDFINTKADMSGVPLGNYKIIKKGRFVFNVNTARMGDKFAIALCDDKEHIVSSIYGVFSSKDVSVLLPEYLMLFFKRPEFDRYVRFHSWGSAREVFTMDDIKEVLVPIPSLLIQQEIVNIYKCYIERKRIVDQLKEQLGNLCPILIKGSLQTNN